MPARLDVEQYLPMIEAIAGGIVAGLPSSFELSDLISEGVLALYEAFERFDCRRGVEFGAFARFRVRGAILDAVRSDYRHCLRHAEITEEIPSPEPDLLETITAHESLRVLRGRQVEVISHRFLGGRTKRETGRRMGLSEQWVGKLEARAIGSMRSFAAAA